MNKNLEQLIRDHLDFLNRTDYETTYVPKNDTVITIESNNIENIEFKIYDVVHPTNSDSLFISTIENEIWNIDMYEEESEVKFHIYNKVKTIE